MKRDKIIALNIHLNVTGDPGLANIDRFMIKKYSKTGNTDLLFLDGNKHWQSLTNKRTGEVATKFRRELRTDSEMESIPLQELSSLVEDIHVETREASQNTDLDMWEFLGIDKTLQSIQGELLNNT